MRRSEQHAQLDTRRECEQGQQGEVAALAQKASKMVIDSMLLFAKS
jgi:hypothetical protein